MGRKRLEKLEPSLTLKNDNLLPGASGGPYTFNVWKSRIRKRNQRRKYHLNNDWKGTFGFALMPQHSATVCDKCGTRNDLSELLLYSTEGCEVNCFGCLSHETCLICEDRFYLKNGNCYPSDICPHGIQSFNMPGKLPDVVCVTCSNGFSHCKGLTGYGRPATYVPSFNPFENEPIPTPPLPVFETPPPPPPPSDNPFEPSPPSPELKIKNDPAPFDPFAEENEEVNVNPSGVPLGDVFNSPPPVADKVEAFDNVPPPPPPPPTFNPFDLPPLPGE